MNIKVIISGKVIEVGRLTEGDGIVIEVDGETVCLAGLTPEETKTLGHLLDKPVTLTIEG